MADTLIEFGFEQDYYNNNFSNFEQSYINTNINNNNVNLISKKNVIQSKKKIIPSEIYNKVRRYIIGQDEALKTIITTIIKNNTTTNPQFKSNIFLIGQTGNGKTESIKQIAKQLDLPYVIEDASKYTQEGYVGENVEQALVNLINVAQGDLKKASRGIIVFDEIDKKTDTGDRDSGVATTSVQESLLKLVEGTTIQTIKGRFDTGFITFIFIGACERVYLARKKRLGDKNIGFKSVSKVMNQKEVLLDKSKNPDFLPEDLINAGFKSELVGRIDIIQEFKSMDENMAKKILLESDNSILRFYIKELGFMGITVKMDNKNEIIDHIAKRAVKQKMGARGLRQVVVEMFSDIYSYIILKNISPNDRYICIITKDTVYNSKSFKLCKKEFRN